MRATARPQKVNREVTVAASLSTPPPPVGPSILQIFKNSLPGRFRPSLLAVIGLGSLLLIGCAQRSARQAEGSLPSSFAANFGFDVFEDSVWPRPGDSVLYRLEGAQSGERHEWYVRMSIEAAPSQLETYRLSLRLATGEVERHELELETLPALVEVYEVGTHEVGRTRFYLPRECFEWTPFDWGQPNGLPIDPEKRTRAVLVSLATLAPLFSAAVDDPTLGDIMRRAIGPPPLWKLAIGELLGRSPSFHYEDATDIETAVEEWPSPIGSIPTTVVDGEVRYGRDPLMTLRVWYSESRPPFHVGLGIIRLEGRHPEDPSRWVRGELIGAQRGPYPGIMQEPATASP